MLWPEGHGEPCGWGRVGSTGGRLKEASCNPALLGFWAFFLPPWLHEVLCRLCSMVQSDSDVGAGGFLAKAKFLASLMLCGGLISR